MQLLVLFCFLLSGISGLTLEIIWTRMLEHVFGATTLAISTVLTCFMGGLALGSWLFGKYSDKLRSPLAVYAVAEGIIGFSALLIPLTIERLYGNFNLFMAAHLSNNFLLFSLVRFAAVALLLLIPTTCMGATLPLLSRYFMTDASKMSRVGQRVGVLYTVNTIGAVGGVFLTTFALLPVIGLHATNWFAGTINICLCISILVSRKWLSFWFRKNKSESAKACEFEDLISEEPGLPSISSAQRRAVMLAFFMSGLASMNIQVVWNRAMSMIIGASVYSFSIVLIAFLLGLASGSAVFSKLLKNIRNPVFALALVELAIAFAAMLNYLYMDDLPRSFAQIVTNSVSSYSEHVVLIQLLMFAVAAIAVLPATFFMGATFPLTIRSVSNHLERVGSDVGRVYALNTLGAICGSFLSAFVFMPFFSRYFGGTGMQTAFFLSVAVYVALGLILAAVSKNKVAHRIAVAAPTAVLVLAFFLWAPAWNPAAMTLGVFRVCLMKNALDEESWGNPDIKYYFDGVTTTVSIEVWGSHYALKNNGKVDASSGEDMPTQIMMAAYPLLFHRAGPKDLDVAIIGFGSGVTVGAALEFPVKNVDTIELENAVVEASRVFGTMEGNRTDPNSSINHLVYREPTDPKTGKKNQKFDWSDPNTYVINDRLKIMSNDGRNYLASSLKKYDVIISEPSNPWITGVANMFTSDNFASAVKALSPNGIYCQWVQLYELSPENIKTIFRTFAGVFPYVALFAAENYSSDTMLLGSFSPISFDLDHIEKSLKNTRIKKELERAYIFSAPDVFARVLLVNRKELLQYTNGNLGEKAANLPINTDDNALIEFSAPRDLISFKKFAGYFAHIYTDEWCYGKLWNVIENTGTGENIARNLSSQAISLLSYGRKQSSRDFQKEAEKTAPNDPFVREASLIVSYLNEKKGEPIPVFEDLEPAIGITETQFAQLKKQYESIIKSLDAQAIDDAMTKFAGVPENLWQNGGPQMMLLEGYIYYLNADPKDQTMCEDSVEILSRLARENEQYAARHCEIFYYLAICHTDCLHYDKAVKSIRQYVAMSESKKELDTLSLKQAKADLDASLLGIKGTTPIDLPPDPPGSPTTDSRGESKKDFREGESF